MASIHTLRADALAGRLTVFAGAGVSASPPACLPLAKELIGTAVDAIGAGIDAALKDAVRSAASNLRPEVFTDALIDLCGSSAVGFLRALSPGVPADSHRLIAANLAFGGTVITTNFDTLIEAAGAETGIRVECCFPPFFMATASDGSAMLYKLHGTLPADNPRSLKQLAISVQQTSRMRTGRFAQLLKHLFVNAKILFVGYSGLDDFDLNPTFRGMDLRQSEVVWLNHGADAPPGDLDRPLGAPPSGLAGAVTLFPNIDYVTCETTVFLRLIFQGVGIIGTVPPSPQDLRKRAEIWSTWANTLPMPAAVSLGVIALAAAKPLLAKQLFDLALGEPGLIAPTRRRVQLLLASALRQGGRPGEALTICTEIRSHGGGSRRFRAEVMQASGACRRVKSDWIGAAHDYLTALRSLKGIRGVALQRAELRNSLAIALDKLGKTRAAIRIASALPQYAERQGYLGLLSRVRNNLGLWQANLGRYDLALEHLSASLATKCELGDINGMGNAFHNLGWLHALRGDARDARGAFLNALKLRRGAVDTNWHGLAQTRSALGQLRLKRGNLKSARILLTSAFEGLGEAQDLYGQSEVSVGLARIATSTNDQVARRCWLSQTQSLIAQMSETPEVRRLKATLAQVEADALDDRR